MLFVEHSKVWIPDDKEVWVEATVIRHNDEKGDVIVWRDDRSKEVTN